MAWAWVYKAHQVSLNRPVAIKLILGDKLASSDVRSRFRVEAEASANLDHPNIVPIYETGEHEGQPYLCMRLVEGENLAEVLRSRTGDSSEGGKSHDFRYVVAKVARAVHYAHGRGILHRDLKPSNVLIDGETAEPFVTDFGLAKFVDTDDDITRSAAMLGTPHYMSPEQCQGGAGNVTVASDVYALGGILYELLAGKPPFHGDTTLEVIRKIADEEPPRFNGLNVPRDLETICRKCLEKEPEKRYASALALAEDLERFERGEPVLARPVFAPERAYRWCKRNKALAGLGAAATVAVLLGLFGVVKSRQEVAQRSLSQAYNYAHMVNQAWRSYDNLDLNAARDYLDRARPELGEKDRRDWEWRYLWALLKDNANLRLGPIGSQNPDEDSRIGSVEFSPDGESLIVATNRGRQVEVWHIEDQKRTHLLDLRPRERRVLALCPQREWVAVRTLSNKDHQAIEILRVDDGALLHQWQLSEDDGVAVNADFSFNGRYLAVGSKKQGCWVFDTESEEIAYSVPSSKTKARTYGAFVSLSDDGALLTYANAAIGVRTLRWKEEEVDRILFSDADERLYPTAEYYFLAHSPSKRWLAVSGGVHAHPVWLIDLTNGTRQQLHSTSRRALRQIEKQVLGGAPAPPPGSRQGGAVRFSPDSASLLLSGGSDIEIFDIANIATLQSRIIRNPYGGGKGAFSLGGDKYVTTGDPYMFIYRSDSDYAFQSPKFGPVRTGMGGLGNFSSDSRRIAITYDSTDSRFGRVHVVDTATHEDTEIEALGTHCARPQFLPGNRLVVGGPAGIIVYHFDTNEAKRISVECPLPDMNAIPFPLAVIAKLNVLAVAFLNLDDKRRPYVLMDMDRWEVIETGAGHWSLPVNFTADERYVICPSPEGDGAHCAIREVELSATFLDGDPADDHYQADIVYEESGRVLGLWDGKIWDALAGKVIYDQTNSPVRFGNEASFLPGGRRMLAGDDGYLTLWDMETGMPVMTQGLAPRGWGGLHEISPDGNTIAVVSNDGEAEWFIQFWRAPSWEEIEAAEK